MKILALALVAIGAFISYGAKYILQNIIKKEDADNKYTSLLKVLGFVVVLAGAILVFIFA